MLRISLFAVLMLLVAGAIDPASAQTMPATSAPAAASGAAAAKPSRIKLTTERLKAMKAKWSANKGKLAACRKDVRSKGLAGDERWFYIADCMEKT